MNDFDPSLCENKLYKIIKADNHVNYSNFIQLDKWQAQFSSVAQSYPTLCNPMNRSTPDK